MGVSDALREREREREGAGVCGGAVAAQLASTSLDCTCSAVDGVRTRRAPPRRAACRACLPECAARTYPHGTAPLQCPARRAPRRRLRPPPPPPPPAPPGPSCRWPPRAASPCSSAGDAALQPTWGAQAARGGSTQRFEKGGARGSGADAPPQGARARDRARRGAPWLSAACLCACWGGLRDARLLGAAPRGRSEVFFRRA